MGQDRLTRENWYHGQMTRARAEEVLRGAGFLEGLFLVRESSTARGDFVLSVVHQGTVIHYQIRRRCGGGGGGFDDDQDPVFSLSEEQKVIHGLDELVFYYRNQVNTGLQHRLTDHVPGQQCPLDVKLHGTENLLHRAAAGGSLEVVYELLKSGYRNMGAKNPDGQCALHLAAFFGHSEVIEVLLQHGAGANVADSSGYTPLHVAAQAGQAEAVRSLLTAGRANPTVRNQITGWVPLHEAAWKGHAEVARVLLDCGLAPLMPRTLRNETPADLARANGQNEMALELDSWWPLPLAQLWPAACSTESWLHPAIPRAKAISLLAAAGEDGAFLIRQSGKKADVLVLSMSCEKHFYHFEVEKRGIFYFLDQGPYMVSLEHLVDHYSRFADGLPAHLRRPVGGGLGPRGHHHYPPAPPPAKPLSVAAASQGAAAAAAAALRKGSGRGPPAGYENRETLRRLRHSKDDIPAESLYLKETIGEGEFGSVYKAVYMAEDGQVRDVAVKVINKDAAATKHEFIQEANVMMNLDHQCIVQLIGISSGPPLLVVLELVPLGSMLDYMLDHPDSVRFDMEVPLWAAQIACGMVYLEEQRFIHRDLAARNILLASKLQAKISDFGLSRVVNEEKDYYRASKGGRWPIKWYAPECVNFGTFSHAGDVWSYGVLLWEMYTKGKQPYEGMRGDEVVRFIEEGKRLPLPDSADGDVRNMMSLCWEHHPKLRPTFQELLKFFSESPAEYMNLKELLVNQDLSQLTM